ncbi:MAG: MFS transporter [Gammaproteobacteria bacterium]
MSTVDPTLSTPRLRRTQRSTLILLVAAGTLNYFDRSALAIANPLIREELGLSISQMGLLLSAFLWAYAFAQLPGGALVDRLGARRLLGGALAFWSIAQGAAGFVTNLWQFAVARAGLGLGEAPMFPCAASVTRAWFPIRNRALVTGTWNCVSTLGPTLAPPILTALMLAFGWRAMFVILGVVGVVLAVAWIAVYRDPNEVELTTEELSELGRETSTQVEKPSFADWRRLFAYRATWGLVLGYFGTIYMLWLFGTWLPGYLEIQRGLDVRMTGWVAAIPFGFGVFGSIGSGWLADRLLATGHAPIAVRKGTLIIALIGMALFTLGAAYAVSTFAAVACIAGALFCNGCCTSMNWSLVAEVAPPNRTASLGGITNFGGYIGGALAPITTGFIVEYTGSFALALILAAVLAGLSALALFILVPDRPISVASG